MSQDVDELNPLDQIEKTINPVKDRTLIPVDPLDVYRWTQTGDHSDPLIGPKGWEDLLAYKDIVTPDQLDELKVPKDRQRGFRQGMTLLEGKLPKKHGIPKDVYQRQMKTAVMAMMGTWGNEVTLVGLDPTIAGAVSEVLGGKGFEHLDMHLTDTTVDHPLRFAAMDGLVERIAYGDHSLKYVEPPEDEVVTKKEFSEMGKTLVKDFKTGKPKHQKGIDGKVQTAYKKHLKEHKKVLEDVDKGKGRDRHIDI